MADTTLKAYYAYLDELLTRRKFDEVAAHCQHILEKYPKNLGVLRRLAKAQLDNGHYDEAMTLFQRVLTYAPQDVDAYVGLSWVSRQRSQGDTAIYYLERAYEREPNNSEVIGLLREAYRVFHDRANAKLPNTAYMVARQQVRSGLSTQAVKTLQDALIEEPKRSDLRLLLTDIYAQIGQLVDAAKSAVAVLKDLPDCLRANHVLATVWLGAGRPSDAQRLVASIEDIDPYLAYEVAVGTPPSDDMFVLPLLEYRPGGASANVTPDWMANISDFAPTPANTTSNPFRPAPTPEPAPADEAGASWLDMLTPTEDAPTPEATPADDLSWLTEADAVSQAESLRNETNQWVASLDPATAPPPPAIDQNDWLTDSAPSAKPVEDNDDWLTQLGGSVPSASVEAESAAGELEGKWQQDINEAFGASTIIQPMDFSRYRKDHEAAQAEAAAELDQAATTGLTGLLAILSGEDEATPADDSAFASFTDTPSIPKTEDAEDSDSLAWLRDDALEGDTPSLPIVSEIASDEPDPFAWMGEHNIEVIEPSTEVRDFLDDGLGVRQMGSLEPAQEDSMAWARSAGVEVTPNDDGLDGAVNYDDDPFAWMRESGVEVVSDDMPQFPSSEPQLLTQIPGFSMLGSELPDETPDFSMLGDNEPEPDDSPVTEGEISMTGLLAFVGSNAPTDNAEGAMGDNNDIPDWLRASSTDDQPEETPADASSDDGLDWLADLEPSTPIVEAEAVNWQAAPDDDDDDASVPEWMAALEDARDPMELSNISTVESPIIESALTVDEVESGLFDTLMPDGTFATDDAAEDVPDWVMSEPPHTAALHLPEPEAPMPSVTFNPQDDLLLVAPPLPETKAKSKTREMAAVLGDSTRPDEMTEEMAAVLGDVPLDTPMSDADMAEDWLSAMALNAPFAAMTETTDDQPDDFSFDAEPVAAASDDMDFSSLGFRIDTEDAPQADLSADAANEFDWLNDATPPAATNLAFTMVADEDDAVDWLSAAAPVAGSSALDLGGTDDSASEMDWLSDVAPVAGSSALDLGGTDDSASEMDWLSDVAPVAGSSAFDLGGADDAAREIDWLNDPALESDAATEMLSKEDDFALSFFDDEQPSTELGTSFIDDSLEVGTSAAAMFDFDADEASPQTSMTGVDFNDISDDNDLFRAEESPVELSETSAVSAPDWLNALAPGLEVDTDSVDIGTDSDYLGGGRGDYGWLNSLVDEEMRPPVMVSKARTARFPFTTPPQWLQTIREETQQISAIADDMDADDDGLPDWLNDLDDAEKN